MKTMLAMVAMGMVVVAHAAPADADDAANGAGACSKPSRENALSKTKLLGELIALIAQQDLRIVSDLEAKKGEAKGFRRVALELKCDEPALTGKELAEVQAWETKTIAWANGRDQQIAAEEQRRAANPPLPAVPGCSILPTSENAVKALAALRETIGDTFYDQEVDGLAGLRAFKSADLQTASGEVKGVTSWLEDLRCTMPALSGADAVAATSVHEQAKALVLRWSQPISDELECRSSERCLASRICSFVEDRAMQVGVMQREKSTPGGVVNLATIHDAGQAIQGDDEAIRQLKGWFVRDRKKPFTAAMCTTPKQGS